MRPRVDVGLVGALTYEHRRLQTMFDDLQLAMGAGEKRRRAEEVTAELVRHTMAEERYLYPAARRCAPDGPAVADRAVGAHAEVETLLRRLEETEVAHPRFDRLVTSLVSEVMAHVQVEEATLFPRLARHGDPAELAELGRRVRRARTAAPSLADLTLHRPSLRGAPRGGPSPGAPFEGGPSSGGAHPAGSPRRSGSLVDRLRDHLADRI